MREHPGSLLWVETHGDKGVVKGVGSTSARPTLGAPQTFDPIIPAQWGIEVDLVGQQQLSVIRSVAPHHRIYEVVQGGSQILHHLGIEARVRLRILGYVIGRLRIEPMVKEPSQLGLSPWVLDHASGLGANLFRSDDFTAVCGFPECFIWERIPQHQSQTCRGRMAVLTSLRLRVEEARGSHDCQHRSLHRVFQSDAGLKPEVHRAVTQLCIERPPKRALSQLGAEVLHPSAEFGAVGQVGGETGQARDSFSH